MWKPELVQVAEAVQVEFGLFAAINVVSKGELYGGKICAALDRQHPRDLFDIQQLLKDEGITDEVKLGFIAALVGHSRPMNELFNPNFQDQREAFDTQFDGMSPLPFTYEDYESTRTGLLEELDHKLTENDRRFLISFKSGEPDWALSPIDGLESMASVRWKLQNIQKLKRITPKNMVNCLQS